MIEPAIAVSDRSMAPHQYRFVETHAWWLGTFGPHQHLTEHRLRQWIPAQPDREWVLERELTGAQTWLTGSAEEAREDGFDLHDVAPVGRFRARYGAFDTARVVQDLYLDGRKDEAAAALPDDFIDRVTLIGPPSHVKERIAALRAAGVTHLHVNPVGTDVPKLLTQVKEWIS